MNKILLLLFLALSHCSLIDISASDFPDSFFPSGGSADSHISLNHSASSTDGEDYLYYMIFVSDSSGIEQVSISGSTLEETTIEPDEETFFVISDSVLLSYNDTYTRSKPNYAFNVTMHTTEGDTVISNFIVEAIIQNVQDAYYSWTDEGIEIYVSDKGAGLESVTIPVIIDPTSSSSSMSSTTISTSDDNKNYLKIDSSLSIESPSTITLTSTEGISTEYKITKE